MMLSEEIDQLRQERDLLRGKVEQLEGILDMKKREIEGLQSAIKATGNNDEQMAIQQLMQTNENLMNQLNIVQDKLKRLEMSNLSMISNSYMSGR